jgi:hypothetical protein
MRLQYLGRNPAALAASVPTRHRNDVLSCLDPLLDLRAELTENAKPIPIPPLDAVKTAMDASAGLSACGAILDAYCVLTGVPRLELLERAAADWQKNDYGEVKGL